MSHRPPSYKELKGFDQDLNRSPDPRTTKAHRKGCHLWSLGIEEESPDSIQLKYVVCQHKEVYLNGSL